MPEVANEDYEGYFNSFLISYRTREKRLRAAAGFLLGREDASIGSYKSRLQLVARWGHDNEELRDIGHQVWGFTEELLEYKGELALSFVRGSRQVLSEAEDDLDDQVMVTVGTLRQPDLIHDIGAARRVGAVGRNRALRYGMQVTAHNLVTINADIVGELEVSDAIPKGGVPIWEGVSPVTTDIALYRRDARFTQRELVLGTDACVQVIGRLDELTGRQGLLDHVLGLAEVA